MPASTALADLQREQELSSLPHNPQSGAPHWPTNIPKKERTRRKRDYLISVSVGNILGASVYEAGLALELHAAWEDCEEAEYKALELANKTITSFLEAPSIESILAPFTSRRRCANCSRPKQPPIQTELQKRQELEFARTRCARDVISVMRDITVIVALASKAVTSCSLGQLDASCVSNSAGIGKQVTALAQAGAEMNLACPIRVKDAPDSVIYRDLHRCAEKLEKIAWIGDGLFRVISKTEQACNNITKRGNPLMDKLSCAGNVIGAAAYVGSAGLWLTSAVQRDCVLGRALQKFKKKTNATVDDAAELARKLDGEKAKCARDVSAFVRTLLIAAWKANRAAGWCGGFESSCAVNILQSSAAMAASSEAAARSRDHCFKTQLIPDLLDREVSDVECVVSATSLAKELAVVAAFGMDARNSCPNTTFANMECGSRIAKTLAILAYLCERSALIQKRCVLQEDYFGCGRALDDVGQAVNLLAPAIGGAAVNCGLGFFPRITKPLVLTRRFWVPA